MGTQGPVKLSPETPLATNERTSNVAENQKTAEALTNANVDGKDIYPQRVFTEDLVLKSALNVGSNVSIMDGTITSDMIGANQVNASHIYATGLTASDITFTGGGLSEFGISTLGTITGGALSVGEGGVSIGDVSSGISISSNIIRCIKTGVTTVEINGSTGVITASKFALTADATSSLDMTLGSLTIGSTGTINGVAVSTISAATRTFAQTGIPTSTAIGDLWCDTDDGNKLYRAASVGADQITAGEWVAVQDTAYTAKNVTFAQDAIPTALAAGDMWIDTNDSNKMYRAAAAGANEIKAGEWILYRDAGAVSGADAIQPHGTSGTTGVVVDANKKVSVIYLNSGGIALQNASGTAKCVLDYEGLTATNAAGADVVHIDSDCGLDIYNGSDPAGVTERLSFLGAAVTGVRSAGAEAAMLYCSNAAKGGLVVHALSEPLFLEAGLTTGGTWDNDEMELFAGDFIKIVPGANASGADTVYIGDASYTGKKLAIYGHIEFNDDDGTKPTISSGTAPAELDASSEPLGSIFLGTGGSLWLTISSSGNKWTRIFGANANAATAHPT